MKLKFLIVSLSILSITGCNNLFDFNGNSSSTSSTYANYYDEMENHNPENSANGYARRSSNAIDDEKPVQMTPVDSQLKTVRPEVKQPPVENKSNKKVLLPIQNDL